MTRAFKAACVVAMLFLLRAEGASAQPNWSWLHQENYTPVTFGPVRPLTTQLESGYVSIRWTCPPDSEIKVLAQKIVDRTWAGLGWVDWDGTYLVKSVWATNGKTVESVLFAFEYHTKETPKVKVSNRCAFKFPQYLNLDVNATVTVQLFYTTQFGISTSVVPLLDAAAGISGLFLNAPLTALTYPVAALKSAEQSKAGINGFLANYGRSISEEAVLSLGSEDGIVPLNIGERAFTMTKEVKASLASRGPTRRSGFAQYFNSQTGISLDQVRTGISPGWDQDMGSSDLPGVVTPRCRSYRAALVSLGLTAEDVALLLWDELARVSGSLKGAPSCFTSEDAGILRARNLAAPYSGAY